MYAPECCASTATFDQSVTGPPAEDYLLCRLLMIYSNVNRNGTVALGLIVRSTTARTG
jgi:hypothetical protein